MKVKELTTLLSGIDQELEVICIAEDAGTMTILNIESASVVAGEKNRDHAGRPMLKIGEGPNSVRIAALGATSDF